jgi:hypothetical protein
MADATNGQQSTINGYRHRLPLGERALSKERVCCRLWEFWSWSNRVLVSSVVDTDNRPAARVAPVNRKGDGRRSPHRFRLESYARHPTYPENEIVVAIGQIGIAYDA